MRNEAALPHKKTARQGAVARSEKTKEVALSAYHQKRCGTTSERRMFINMRLGCLTRLAAHRQREGTLSAEHAEIFRSEMTWARVARGDDAEGVLRWLTVSWPVHTRGEFAAMTLEARDAARKEQTAYFRRLIRWADTRSGWLRPLTLGTRLAVTPEERALLKLRTIRYAGQTDEVMTRERAERQRARMVEKRVAAGRKPRSQCLSAIKPWEAEGVSRRTWYRRKQATEMSAKSEVAQKCSQYKGIINRDRTAHTSVPRQYRHDVMGGPDRPPHITRSRNRAGESRVCKSKPAGAIPPAGVFDPDLGPGDWVPCTDWEFDCRPGPFASFPGAGPGRTIHHQSHGEALP